MLVFRNFTRFYFFGMYQHAPFTSKFTPRSWIRLSFKNDYVFNSCSWICLRELICIVYHISKSIWRICLESLIVKNKDTLFPRSQVMFQRSKGAGHQRPWWHRPGRPLLLTWIKVQHGYVIIYTVKCGMKLHIHSQTSTVAPLKFKNGWAISSYTS